MSKLPPGRYQLKTLHEEIDLFDRKLAHLLRYEEFATDAARNSAARNLTTKREALVRAAREMVSEGIEYNDAELPRSFRTDPAAVADTPAIEPPDEEPAETVAHARRSSSHPSPYAGTSMDVQKGLQEYKRRKKKA
ncbi:MAG TPA: hypothetical protein VHE33_08865 [Acidobacteriaceae bacterium]|nr:hypothetical protein [Acidobacteriaceae bacterium]